jgi:hypothetical protein
VAFTLTEVLYGLYECEENCSLSSDWDGGWRVTIGGSQHTSFEAEAYVDNPVEAARWLHEQAIQRYAIYKSRYGYRIISRTPRTRRHEVRHPAE